MFELTFRWRERDGRLVWVKSKVKNAFTGRGGTKVPSQGVESSILHEGCKGASSGGILL